MAVSTLEKEKENILENEIKDTKILTSLIPFLNLSQNSIIGCICCLFKKLLGKSFGVLVAVKSFACIQQEGT